jgi:dihydrofolate reductase
VADREDGRRAGTMMGLIYTAIASLDGYVADRAGSFDRFTPDDEVHRSVNELERTVGTMLLGRRMYDVLVAWETMDTTAQPEAIRDFAAIWHASDKVVYSRTLDTPASARTRIERDFEPDAIRGMKASAERDLSIGGPELAGHALRAGLVDRIHLFLNPIVVGGGTRALPGDVEIPLALVDEQRFGNGVVRLSYRVGT